LFGDAEIPEEAVVKVELRNLADIKPYDNNPRNNDAAVDAVAASIREFGFRVPIVVDSDNVIIAGHTRYKAAQKLGLERVPVHVARDLSPEQVRAYRIADNKTAELAEWDYELLPIELAALKACNYDLSTLGFDQDELAQLLDPGVRDGLCDPDDVPAPPDEATTKPGDLWFLGEHRLLCGDSSKPADLDRLLDGATIHLVNTDPPYNVKVEPRSNNAIAAGLSSFEMTHHQKLDVERHPEKSRPTNRKLRAKDRPLANDFVSDAEFDRLLLAWFGNIARVLEPGRGFYIWGGYANVANYPPALKASELYFSQALIWVKLHPVLTRKDFMGAHEWCQPPDTKVLTPEGDVPIASLRDGDRVVSYSTHNSMILGRRRGYEVRRTHRPYRGNIYGVVVGGKTTWATDGHLWSARMTPAARQYWCVYLMRRGSWWRVGKSKLYTSWGFGPKQRLMFEGGEEVWILSLHASNADATTAEQMISVRYGIPTTYWRQSRTAVRPEAEIQRIYDAIDANMLAASAYRALLDHNRRIEYPLLRRETSLEKVGARVPFLARTCNLIPEVMAVPVPTVGTGFVWTPLDEVISEQFDGTVHSLDVEKTHHYVADGLVTHNCFYGWREGAAHQFFGPTNAQDVWEIVPAKVGAIALNQGVRLESDDGSRIDVLPPTTERIKTVGVGPEGVQVFGCNNVTDVWFVKKVSPQKMVHLTEKPVELAVRAMQYSSRAGENILDLFGGSGSTLIGAEQTGRRAYLMELDPLYCDVIVQRFEQFTGKKAERKAA
jgi:DNA modification methylase